jgi:predicted RNA-binding Zn ribbon-like protein
VETSQVFPMAHRLPPPILVGDSPALDFLNTLAVPTESEVEWIGTGEDFISWLQISGLVSQDVIARLRKSALPGELDTVSAQARKLREWFREFVVAHKGRPLKPKALQELEPLNRTLARDEEFGQVVAAEAPRKKGDDEEGPVSGLMWSSRRRWRSPDALLFPIARAMAELVCDDDFSHVRACEGQNCRLIFIDRTKGHARRWCSMAVCGNRAKQAAHRERARR